MKVGVAGAGAADLQQDLPRPGLGNRHFIEVAGLLPLDQLKRLHGLLSSIENSVDIDHQVYRAAEYLAWPVRRWIDDEPGVLHAAKERLDGDVHFQPRERTAEAGMNS